MLRTSSGVLQIHEHVYTEMKNRRKQSHLHFKHFPEPMQLFSQKGRLAKPLLPLPELPLNCPLILFLRLTNTLTGATCSINPSLGKIATNNHEVYRVLVCMKEYSHNSTEARNSSTPVPEHAWLSSDSNTVFNAYSNSGYALSSTVH